MSSVAKSFCCSGVPSPPELPSSVKILEFEEIKQITENTKQSDYISPRSGHRIVCDDGNVYSFGGYLEVPDTSTSHPAGHGVQKLFRELWQLNMADNQWRLVKTKGRTPNELASHSAILCGQNLIIFGGTGVPFGSSSSNQMHIFSLKTKAWSHVCTRGSPPTPQYGQACVLDKGNFYVVGGTTGYAYSLDIYKLDSTTWTWESLFISKGDPIEPTPRYRHEICMRDDLIYVLGGGTASKAYSLATIPTFDVVQKKWLGLATQPTDLGLYPCNRKCHGIVQRGNDVFVFGGYDSKAIKVDIWKLNLDTLKWTTLNISMPVSLYFHSCAITPAGCMYMFGGVTHIKNNTRTNRTFKIWLTVPSLKEMAWEIVTKCNKKLSNCKRNDLLAVGIPHDFLKRLRDPDPLPKSTVGSSSPTLTELTPVYTTQTYEPITCVNNCIGPQVTY